MHIVKIIIQAMGCFQQENTVSFDDIQFMEFLVTTNISLLSKYLMFNSLKFYLFLSLAFSSLIIYIIYHDIIIFYLV